MLNLIFALIALIVEMVTFIEVERPAPPAPTVQSGPSCPGGVCPR
jgi:hypothetical protein